jgi:next-to-BRCA1 protein 1
MPWPIVALVGHAVLKGVAAQAGKHAYDKVVKHKKSKKHDQNPQPQPSSNYIYPDAYCDGCGKFINDGIRYYCLECPNYDLCENCNSLPYIVTSKGVHYRNHRMVKMAEQHQESFASPRDYSASGYSPAMCDVCGIYPIVGTRYKCLQCPDFDLCERCHDLPSIYKSIKGHTAYHNMLPMIQ